MYIIWLKIKALVEEGCWRIKEGIKYIINIFITLAGAIINGFRELLFKLIMIITKITNVGFFIGVILLVINIKECVAGKGISFFETQYFEAMCFLFGIHASLLLIAIIINPKHIE